MKQFYFFFVLAMTVFGAWGADVQRIIPKIGLPAGAPAKEIADLSNEVWNPAGEVKITDDLFASVYKNQPVTTFTAPLEESESTRGLYRIVNPYKNFKPEISGLSFDDEGDYYMILHAEIPNAVWVEDFQTGWTDLDEEDGGPICVVTYPTLYLESYSFDFIYENLPDMFGTLDDSRVSFPATFWNISKSAPIFLLGIGDTSDGYYIANEEGKFAIELPSGWETVGTADYTDDMIASAYEIPVATHKVEVQRMSTNPDLIRLVNPYEPWQEEVKAASLTYDNSSNHYMVIHTEHAPYIWIEDFETGLFDDNGDKIVFASDACYFTEKYGFEDTYDETPGIYGLLKDNVITYAESYDDGYSEYPCLYLEVGDGDFPKTLDANLQGKFRIQLPAGPTPSDPDWDIVGEGTYTDDILTALFPQAGNQTYNVTIEQSKTDPGTYRIANPYAAWQKPTGADVTYDSSKTYYMTFHIAQADNSSLKYVWLDDFATGLSVPDYEIWVTTEAANMMSMMNPAELYSYYPEQFGTFSGLAVRFPATWEEGGEDYPLIMIMEGEDSWDTVDANMSGKFQITFPGFSGITEVTASADANQPEEYYNMQGMRVDKPEHGLYLLRKGNTVKKVIIR